MSERLVRGYTQQAITENISILMNEGLDEDTSLSMSIAYARGLFKQDNPSSTMFPKHLIPSLAIKMYRESKVV